MAHRVPLVLAGWKEFNSFSFAVDGNGTALAIRTAGATSSDKLRSESVETRLITS